MIITINKPNFQDLISADFLELPIRWDGKDFYKTVCDLFQEYIALLSSYLTRSEVRKVDNICQNLLLCIEEYHKGFPNQAFKKISSIMNKLNEYSGVAYTACPANGNRQSV